MVSLDPEALTGHVLTGVTSSWHEFEGIRSAEPVYVWLSCEELGTLRLHTLNGLVITVDEVHASFGMGEYGRIVVERGAPPALSDRVGERIEACPASSISHPAQLWVWSSTSITTRSGSPTSVMS